MQKPETIQSGNLFLLNWIGDQNLVEHSLKVLKLKLD